eukprot:4974675-Pleurochrysis_carterae.AAC.2
MRVGTLAAEEWNWLPLLGRCGSRTLIFSLAASQPYRPPNHAHSLPDPLPSDPVSPFSHSFVRSLCSLVSVLPLPLCSFRASSCAAWSASLFDASSVSKDVSVRLS